MSEPKPVWNLDLESISDPPGALPIEEWRKRQVSIVAMALGVPSEYFKPSVSSSSFRDVSMALNIDTAAFERALVRLIEAERQAAIAKVRLAIALEQLRMKMIGRRYQAILAVLVVLVYLIVEMATR